MRGDNGGDVGGDVGELGRSISSPIKFNVALGRVAGRHAERGDLGAASSAFSMEMDGIDEFDRDSNSLGLEGDALGLCGGEEATTAANVSSRRIKSNGVRSPGLSGSLKFLIEKQLNCACGAQSV